MFPPCLQVDTFNRTLANASRSSVTAGREHGGSSVRPKQAAIGSERISNIEIAARYLGSKIANAAQKLGKDIEATVRYLLENIETAADILGMNIETTADFLREMERGIEERATNVPAPSSRPRPPIQSEDPCIKTAGNITRSAIDEFHLERLGFLQRQEEYRLQQHQQMLLAHHHYLQQKRQYLAIPQEYRPQPLSIDIPDETFMPEHHQQRPDLLIPATNAGPGIYQGGNSIDIFFVPVRVM